MISLSCQVQVAKFNNKTYRNTKIGSREGPRSYGQRRRAQHSWTYKGILKHFTSQQRTRTCWTTVSLREAPGAITTYCNELPVMDSRRRMILEVFPPPLKYFSAATTLCEGNGWYNEDLGPRPEAFPRNFKRARNQERESFLSRKPVLRSPVKTRARCSSWF